MRKILFAGLLALLATAPAQALCVSMPDNASSENIRNNASKMLCLQEELAANAARAQEQARTRSDINNAITMMELQRKLSQPVLPQQF